MLLDIKIRHFTMIDALDITLAEDMTVLTGETGAGKSVFVDAIELALGGRTDVSLIRQGESHCEVSLCFDVSDNPGVKAWLIEQEWEDGEDCLIRRTLSCDGRSRCYVNDHRVSLKQAKTLATFLLTIHGQHHNRLLFDGDHQRQQVDSQLLNEALIASVKQSYQRWQNACQAEKKCFEKALVAQQKMDFLNYQLNELNALALQDGELDRLMSEQKQLAHAEKWLHEGHSALEKIAHSEKEIFKAHGCLKPISLEMTSLSNIALLLENAHIALQEANRELESYLEQHVADPQALPIIEQRLSDIYTLARKYRVPPEVLPALHVKLTQELAELTDLEGQKEALTQEIKAALAAYTEAANALSQQRREVATSMAQQVQMHLPALGMKDARFEIKLMPVDPSLHGLERIEFWVSTNLGQPLQPLEKVVSGGELSRLNLAIQAVFAKQQGSKVLIFDEIDTGMGGAAAEQVGKLLRLLAKQTQVLTITHLPQVAMHAKHHYAVEKVTVKGNTHTTLQPLSEEARAYEMARMLGGVKITDQTLAHARELLLTCA